MRYVILLGMTAFMVVFAFGQSDLGDATPSDTVRLVEMCDNRADDAVARILSACDALQAKIDKGEKIDLRKELTAALLVTDEKSAERVMDKVSAELANAGIRLEYVAKNDKGDVVKSGEVGAKATAEP